MSALEDLEAGLPPELLVPGDIDSVESAALECQRIADKLADSRKNVDYIELRDGDWTGGAAEVYFAVRDADVGVLQVSSEALQQAAVALASYASTLRDARRRAAEALEEYRTGKVAAEQTWTSTTVVPFDVPFDPTVVEATPVTDPAITTAYQDGPVRKLMQARDDVQVAGTDAAWSLERTREVAPTTAPPPGTPPTTTVPGTPNDVWSSLETGVETFETTATTIAPTPEEVVPAVVTPEEAFAETLTVDAEATGGGMPGSAGTAALLSVLALFGGAAAVAVGKNVRGPSALATSLPPGAFGERLAGFGERSGGMPMTGAPVGQGGLGSAMRGAGGSGGSLGHSGSRGSGVDVSGQAPRRRGRMRGFSTWLDEADLADDGTDDPIDDRDER